MDNLFYKPGYRNISKIDFKKILETMILQEMQGWLELETLVSQLNIATGRLKKKLHSHLNREKCFKNSTPYHKFLSKF